MIFHQNVILMGSRVTSLFFKDDRIMLPTILRTNALSADGVFRP